MGESVDAAAALFASVSADDWTPWLSAYDSALAVRSAAGEKRKKETRRSAIVIAGGSAGGKPKEAPRGGQPEALSDLDSWLRSTWPRESGESGLTCACLERIVCWKLRRGQFRPLLPRVRANSAAAVAAAWAAAGAAAGPGAAVLALTALGGVGPATASAILAPVREDCPFMSDEALRAAGFPLKYDLRTYEAFAASLGERALGLGSLWTAEKVGRALWARAVLALAPAPAPAPLAPSDGPDGRRGTDDAASAPAPRKRPKNVAASDRKRPKE